MIDTNGQLLSGELASSLTGRHLSIELFPFDLLESSVPRRHLIGAFL